MRLRGGIVVAFAAMLLAPPSAHAAGSVTARVDPAMTGFFADEELVPPLVARWSIPAQIRSLLASDGRVYVTDGNGAVAFDLATGRQLWAVALPDPYGTAYDGGLLFVRTPQSLVALDSATGAVRWTVELDRPVLSPRAPEVVAVSGVVYVGDEFGLLALRAGDGSELWRNRDTREDTPGAVDEERIYAAAGCGSVRALARDSGAALWETESNCSGSYDDAPAVFGGRVWSPVPRRAPARPHAVHDAASGAEVGQFEGHLPVFVDGLAIFSDGYFMRALDAATFAERWSRPGHLGPTIAIGHDVYGVREKRTLVAISAEDGATLWTTPVAAEDVEASQLLAAAPGTLLVASAGRLTAYGSVYKPTARGVAFGASDADPKAGSEVTLTGVLGRELRGHGVMVRIDGAEWRGRFEKFADVRAARDGGFSTRVVVYRNSRFRVVAPGEGSQTVTVYATPHVVVGTPRGGVAGVSVRSPRTRLAGRTLVLYRDPRGRRPLQRLAAGRLRTTGPGRTRTRVALSSRRGRLVFCIRGQLRLGLGRPNALNRRCGARRIPS